MDVALGKERIVSAIEWLDAARADLLRADRVDALDSLKMARLAINESIDAHPAPLPIKAIENGAG